MPRNDDDDPNVLKAHQFRVKDSEWQRFLDALAARHEAQASPVIRRLMAEYADKVLGPQPRRRK